jgi:Domain of unknown function (DUF4148)
MKVTTIALTFAAGALTATAYAANAVDAHTAAHDAQPTLQWTTAQDAPQVKTRAEVRQELVRAEKEYPPENPRY